MAYKKYIKKNGKLYGPYLYHSKRVDGKVVSEYYGSKKINYKNFLFIFLGIVLISAIILLLIFPNKSATGNIVFGLETSYEKDKPLNGILEFSLQEGELLPVSSKIILENSGQTYEFSLSEILNKETAEGNYYIKDKELSGSGTGYGIEGEKEIYPEVEFTFLIYNELTEEEIYEEQPSEENLSKEIPQEEIVKEEPSAKITGGFLTFLFGTGLVSLELENEITEKVSKEREFVYELKEGQTAELKPKSVKINGEYVNDNFITLKIESNKLIVTTDYSEIEKSYGKEYLGEERESISLDLSNLNLILEEGELTVSIIYEEEEFFQLKTELKEGEQTSNESIEEPYEPPIEIPEEVETNESEKNETIEELINNSIWEIGDFLTEEEKQILKESFGNITLQNIKAELFNGRIIREYSFANYYVEYSYDPSLTEKTLEVQMERDRIKFLKDIANSILKEEPEYMPLEEYKEEYNF